MGRPKLADRPIEKTICLPQSLATKVDLLLYSKLEQRVPHGAWARYIKGLVEKDLERRAAGAAKQQQESMGASHV